MNAPARHPEPHEPVVHDSTPVVMHARRLSFVMVLTSLLIVSGIYFGDDYRYRNAIDEMGIVSGLMALWHLEIQDNRFFSLPTLIAGRPQDRLNVVGVYDLDFVQKESSNTKKTIECSVVLDLNQYFFAPNEDGAQYVAASSQGPIRAAMLDAPNSRRRQAWSVTRSPEDLRGFSELWDILASNPRAVRFADHPTAVGIRKGVVVHDSHIYTVVKETEHPDISPKDTRETVIAHVDKYANIKTKTRGPSGNLQMMPSPYWSAVVKEWKAENFDTVAASTCRTNVDGTKDGPFLFVFPVRFRQQTLFWNELWFNRALSKKLIPSDSQIKIVNRTRLSFRQAFPNLTREADGLESLKLNDLRLWMEKQATESGQSIEVGGIRVPRGLLRLIGVFVIVAIQAYAVLHLAEATTRMAEPPRSDPAAFQAWIVLYNSLSSRFASVCMLATPPIATFAILVRLHEGYVSPATSIVTVLVSFASAMLTLYSIDKASELRQRALSHRRKVSGAVSGDQIRDSMDSSDRTST